MSELGGSTVPSSPEKAVAPPSPASPSGGALTGFAALAALALVLGRGVAPALPGSQSGIARVIAIADKAAAFTGQVLMIAGLLLAVRILVLTVREPALPAAYKILGLASGGLVITIALGAARATLDPGPVMIMALSGAVAALLAVPVLVRPPRTRALGFVLALQGIASVVQLVARVLSMYASDQAITTLYQSARYLATAVFALDAASIVIALLWLCGSHSRRLLVLSGSLLLPALLVSWMALAGASDAAPMWQVVLSRMFGGMMRHPAPLLAPLLRYTIELFALFAAVSVLVSKRGSALLRSAIALAVLARASSDIPALALCLVISAGLAALATVERRAQSRPDPVLTEDEGETHAA